MRMAGGLGIKDRADQDPRPHHEPYFFKRLPPNFFYAVNPPPHGPPPNATPRI